MSIQKLFLLYENNFQSKFTSWHYKIGCPGCVEETTGNCILIMNEKAKISSKSAQGVEEGNQDDNLGETMPAWKNKVACVCYIRYYRNLSTE